MVIKPIQFPDNELYRAKKFFLTRKPEHKVRVINSYLDYYKELQREEYNPIRATLIPFLHGLRYEINTYKGAADVPAEYNLASYRNVH